jgi:Protein of unknown function DUF262
MKSNSEQIEEQIREKQRSVDYDVKEFTIEILVQKYLNNLEQDDNEIYIPSYQREFVWDKLRQSKFIESIILGLPVPYIFTADNADGRLEIVDGSQRIRCLANYLTDNLKLGGLEILNKINGLSFKMLNPARQRKINNATLRMIVLSDKSDEDSRFMLFERINTGSDLLNDMEKRRGIYQGKFTEFLTVCAANPKFNKVTKFTESTRKRREPEELVLRFFAFSEKYQKFSGNLNEFLNNYVTEKNRKFNKRQFIEEFENTMNFVDKNFLNGFVRHPSHNSTPRVRFEALAVGTNLALKSKPNLRPKNVTWLNSQEFENEITGSSTNTSAKVKSRIEFVKNKLVS